MDKKGITIMIAGFLLVSFAVAVSAVVTNIASAQVEEQAECAIDVNLKLSEIGGQPQACYDQTEKAFSFTLENGLNIKVEGLLVNIIGKKKAETFELNDAQIPKGGVYVGYIPYDQSTAGDIRQVRLTPKVMPYDKEEVCTEKSLAIEEIKDC